MERGFRKYQILGLFFPVWSTKLLYKKCLCKRLNLDSPQNINEKLQWLKFNKYSNDQIVTDCIDKVLVKTYLERKGYGELSAKLIGIYNTPEELEIDWDRLPDRFVIKCNHGCGYNYIVRNKKEANVKAINKVLRKWIKENYWSLYCETQYKNIRRKIFVEEFLGENIQTYKFYCFNGKPKVLYVSSNGEDGSKDKYIDYFDMDWNLLPIELRPHPHSLTRPEKPKCFESMKQIAEELSKDFPFVRVDLYDIDGKVMFSEFTFIPTGGFMNLNPESTLDEWGSWLNLSDLTGKSDIDKQ